MSERKNFHLGDVLSITTGYLVSPRRMEGVYDILNWMSRDDLYTHQLPRVADECKPALLRQHPGIAAVDASCVTQENFAQWLETQCAEFGETLLIEQLPEHAHEYIDPLSELAERVHPDKIVQIVVGGSAK